MGVVAFPVASSALDNNTVIVLFAIPPMLVGIFFGAYRERTRRSLRRLAIAELGCLAIGSALVLIKASTGRATSVLAHPAIGLAIFAWPLAFVGCVGRMAADTRRRRRVAADAE